MKPPPPRSTLFPYTTLFRSQQRSKDLFSHIRERNFQHTEYRYKPLQSSGPKQSIHFTRRKSQCRFMVCKRSEEHTSELQSRPHLVCRLLLEKKKNKNTECIK